MRIRAVPKEIARLHLTMILIGKEGCPKCKDIKAAFPYLQYIEIPDIQTGLGDTICSVTCWLGIIPCRGCRLRQNWCNKVFPYFWNIKKMDPKYIEIKRKVYKLGVRQFPVIVDDEISKIHQSSF